MPIYSFLCTHCHHADSEFAPMSEAVPWGMAVRCPECGNLTYARQIDAVQTDLKDYQKPIEMHSVAATSPDELRQLQKTGVEIRDGVPIARNRKEKLSVLKAVGYKENN